jgi:hypothetical protein
MTSDRRGLLIGLPALLLAACLHSQEGTSPMTDIPAGKLGDFDFLHGEWRIRHRRLPQGATEWDEFEGEASCWTVLGGIGSVEELRIPARDFSGMGLRLLDQSTLIWHDLWVNAKGGALAGPGTPGGFANGAGIFDSTETIGGKTMIYRGVWDEITATSCRWRQMASEDGGVSWAENWVMLWTRIATEPAPQTGRS